MSNLFHSITTTHSMRGSTFAPNTSVEQSHPHSFLFLTYNTLSVLYYNYLYTTSNFKLSNVKRVFTDIVYLNSGTNQTIPLLPLLF